MLLIHHLKIAHNDNWVDVFCVCEGVCVCVCVCVEERKHCALCSLKMESKGEAVLSIKIRGDVQRKGNTFQKGRIKGESSSE